MDSYFIKVKKSASLRSNFQSLEEKLKVKKTHSSDKNQELALRTIKHQAIQ